jgi:hypothetical protein
MLTLAMPCLLLYASALHAADAVANTTGASVALPVKMIAVKIVDHRTRQPLAELRVEVISSVPLQCLRPPCGEMDKQQWLGSTDAAGVLRYPASLDQAGAIVHVHAVGSDFAADVHGDGKRDARKRPIVLLEAPVSK